MKYTLLLVTAGLAIFSMFFGSANLVYPIVLGAQAFHHYPWAILGIFLTGVILPFSGVLGVILFEGNPFVYFSKVGRYAPFLFSLLLLPLLGPLVAIPRCMLVAYGGIQLLFPECIAWKFYLFFALMNFFMICAPSRIVEFLGKWITPMLLLGIALMMGLGWKFHTPLLKTSESSSKIFFTSLYQSAQTMDLLAAFFFSGSISVYLKKRLANSHQLVIASFFSGLLGASLLTLVSASLVYLGACYAPFLEGLPYQKMLPHLAQLILGRLASPILTLIIILACISTSVILTQIFSDFLVRYSKGFIKNELIAGGMTLSLSCFIALLGFESINAFLGSFLILIYPGFIALSIGNLIDYWTSKATVKPLFYSTLIFSILKWIWNFLN